MIKNAILKINIKRSQKNKPNNRNKYQLHQYKSHQISLGAITTMETTILDQLKIIIMMVKDSISQNKMEHMKGRGKMEKLKDMELVLTKSEIY